MSGAFGGFAVETVGAGCTRWLKWFIFFSFLFFLFISLFFALNDFQLESTARTLLTFAAVLFSFSFFSFFWKLRRGVGSLCSVRLSSISFSF